MRETLFIANKNLGQCFLFDKNICRKIIDLTASNIEGKIVLEIGPGLGSLTHEILSRKPKKLLAIEKDTRLKDVLVTNNPTLHLIYGDALNFKLSDLISKNEKLIIISNLPYNIGTKLILNWLREINYIDSITVMLQREVVNRIIAQPSTKIYGRISVISQLMMKMSKLFEIAPTAFIPRPKIYSAILSMKPRDNIPSKDILQNIQLITSYAFKHRRKQLKNSLKELIKEKNIPQYLLDKMNKRAEDITPNEYHKLCLALFNYSF